MGMPAVACMLVLQERCEVRLRLSKLSPHCKHTDWLVQSGDSFHSRCRSLSFFVAQSYLSSVLASLWNGARCVRVGLRVDWSLATPAYDSVPARCAVGLRGCGYRAPWLWPARHWPRCSIRVDYRQVFPELEHALDRRTRSLIFASFWNAWRRDRKRACAACARAESHENHLHRNLERG